MKIDVMKMLGLTEAEFREYLYQRMPRTVASHASVEQLNELCMKYYWFSHKKSMVLTYVKEIKLDWGVIVTRCAECKHGEVLSNRTVHCKKHDAYTELQDYCCKGEKHD